MKFLLLLFPLFFFACGSSTPPGIDSLALDSVMKATTQQPIKKDSFYESDNPLPDQSAARSQQRQGI
jgi:hypothetical protein